MDSFRKHLGLPFLVVLLTVVAVVVGFGCGGDDEQEPGATAGVTATAVPGGTEHPPIEVGVAAPYSGPIAYYGQYLVDAVLELVKKDLGTTITYDDGSTAELRFTKIDEACDPTTALAEVNRVIDRVVVMLGPVCSLAALAVAPVLAENEIPHIIASYDPQITAGANEWVFSVSATSEDISNAVAEHMREQGYSRIAVAHDTSSYGESGAAVFGTVLAELGLDQTGAVSFDLGDVDYSGQALRIDDSGADAVYIVSYETEAGLLTKTIRQLGSDIPVYVTAGEIILPQFLNTAGDAAEGVVGDTPILTQEPNPEVQAYIDRYIERFGFENFTEINKTYIAYQVLLDALERAGPNPTGAQIRDALRETNLTTMFGGVSFDENGRWTSPRIVIGRVEDGEVRLVPE